jgi:hypothetical protein
VETLKAQFCTERGMIILSPSEESAAKTPFGLAGDGKARARMLEAQRHISEVTRRSASPAQMLRVKARGLAAANITS